MAFDRAKERREARRQLAEQLRAEHPEFVKEMESKYGFSFDMIIALFLPLIMKWLEEWLDNK